MAILNFPSPSFIGETYTANGKTWVWNGVSWSNNTSGYTGSRGDLGYTGSIGYTGSAGAGYTGSQGSLGYTGSIGYTGSQGTQGVIGYTGSQGIQGVIGYTGSRGLQGYTGSQGTQGVIGYTGSQGTQGVIGYTGSQGPIGYTGSGNVTGPASATNNNLAAFDGTTGKIIKDSGVATSSLVLTTGDQSIAGKKIMTPTVATGASTEQAFRIAPNTLAGSPEWRNMFNIQSTYNAGANGHGLYIKANASNQFELVTDWSTHLRLGVITNGGSAANATAAKYLNLTTSAITWDGNTLLDSGNYNTYAPTLTGTGASGTWSISVSGNAGTVTNGVYTTGDQTIGGVKTFSSNPVVGGLVLDSTLQDYGAITTTATTQVTLASFVAATYGSGEFLIQATQGTIRHITKLLVVHNGTTADATEYGVIRTGASLFTTDVDISGGNVRLLITPAGTTSTAFKTSYTLIGA